MLGQLLGERLGLLEDLLAGDSWEIVYWQVGDSLEIPALNETRKVKSIQMFRVR